MAYFFIFLLLGLLKLVCWMSFCNFVTIFVTEDPVRFNHMDSNLGTGLPMQCCPWEMTIGDLSSYSEVVEIPVLGWKWWFSVMVLRYLGTARDAQILCSGNGVFSSLVHSGENTLIILACWYSFWSILCLSKYSLFKPLMLSMNLVSILSIVKWVYWIRND